MKKGKSPDTTEITPSKKKLKQARLPFKILSDVSPTSITPPTRKRKLSTPDPESATKMGKISNENTVVDELVVISDEDSKDSSTVIKPEKSINPYVKLVDMARKKRLQKSSGKKRKGKKSKKPNGSLDNGTDSANDTGDDKDGDCDPMDVDDPKHDNIKTNKQSGEVSLSETEITNYCITKINKNESDSVIELLEDSNDFCGNKQKNNTSEEVNHKDITPGLNKDQNESMVEKTSAEPSVENSDENIKNQEPTVIKSLIDNKQKDNTIEEENRKDLSPDLNKDQDVSTVENPSTEQSVDNSDENMKEKELTVVESPITPKRSLRNRNKTDQTTPTSTKLNLSVNSNLSTPTNKSLSATNSLDDSVSETSAKNLTPKQVSKLFHTFS